MALPLSPVALVAAGFTAGLLASRLTRNAPSFGGKVVLITGGSRGLGLLLAREFSSRGAKVAICARTSADLVRAALSLKKRGANVLAIPCDVSSQDDVERMVQEVRERCGEIDVLVNNAGVIQVGPLASMNEDDFRDAMDVMFWGALWPSLAVIPAMRRRRGQIVNITSIGGKISVPHLLPYCCAKFAAVALSEGLHTELKPDGISVTTVVPGLMRTGSHLNAYFKGDQPAEYRWFALGATSPGLSMRAERAARLIVEATARREREVTLGAPAKFAARFYGMFPQTALAIGTSVNTFVMPTARARADGIRTGAEAQAQMGALEQSVFRVMNRFAAPERKHENRVSSTFQEATA